MTLVVAAFWTLLPIVHGYLLSPPVQCGAGPCRRPLDITACDRGVDDLNWLQTKLNQAVTEEDYETAVQLRDRIERAAGAAGVCDWGALGVPEWLTDRLQRLDFPMPTRVQLQSLRTMPIGDDAAICAETGSGKSLAYLVPALSQLSEDLMQEDLSLFLSAALKGGQSKAWAKEQLQSDRRMEDEMETPALLIVVPTRELGVQVSLLAYRLLGGGESNPTLQPYTHPSRYKPGSKANMFSYQGPRHVRVAGLWDEASAYAAAYQDNLKGVHIIVGTPLYLSRVALSGNLRLHALRMVVVDEADACLGEHDEAMTSLRRRLEEGAPEGRRPPQTVLAGASLSPSLVQHAVDAGWVRAPTLVTELGSVEAVTELAALQDPEAAAAAAGGVEGAGAAPLGAAAGWLHPRVHPGHAHEYVVCPPAEAVSTLCKLLRARFEPEEGGYTDKPRVIVFAASAEEAIDTAKRLQGALWASLGGDQSAGLWGLSVLLPSSEEERLSSGGDGEESTLAVLESSLRVMEMFRVNQTSVLVTTVAATRGLDFPAVTDVFNLGIVGSAADYLHRAGRIGRIGQPERGAVVSVLQPAEVPELLDLAAKLRFAPREVAPPAPRELSDASDAREGTVQTLEEIFSLYN